MPPPVVALPSSLTVTEVEMPVLDSHESEHDSVEDSHDSPTECPDLVGGQHHGIGVVEVDPLGLNPPIPPQQ